MSRERFWTDYSPRRGVLTGSSWWLTRLCLVAPCKRNSRLSLATRSVIMVTWVWGGVSGSWTRDVIRRDRICCAKISRSPRRNRYCSWSRPRQVHVSNRRFEWCYCAAWWTEQRSQRLTSQDNTSPATHSNGLNQLQRWVYCSPAMAGFVIRTTYYGR